MGVYIKRMKMPNDCRECRFEGYLVDIGQTYCVVCLKVLATAFKPISFDGRPKWCPLTEVSRPHGKLIDGDELIFHLSKYQIQEASIYGAYKLGNSDKFEAISNCIDIVESEHTVIEAEGK